MFLAGAIIGETKRFDLFTYVFLCGIAPLASACLAYWLEERPTGDKAGSADRFLYVAFFLVVVLAGASAFALANYAFGLPIGRRAIFVTILGACIIVLALGVARRHRPAIGEDGLGTPRLVTGSVLIAIFAVTLILYSPFDFVGVLAGLVAPTDGWMVIRNPYQDGWNARFPEASVGRLWQFVQVSVTAGPSATLRRLRP